MISTAAERDALHATVTVETTDATVEMTGVMTAGTIGATVEMTDVMITETTDATAGMTVWITGLGADYIQ